MTPEQIEQTARWWAQRLGDEMHPEFPDFVLDSRCNPGIVDLAEDSARTYRTAHAYLDDMNTARSAREWAMDNTPYRNSSVWREATYRFTRRAFNDCPRALYDLALACGMEETK